MVGQCCAPQKILNAYFKLFLFVLYCGCEISHLYVVYTQFLNARAQGPPVLLLLCQTKLAH